VVGEGWDLVGCRIRGEEEEGHGANLGKRSEGWRVMRCKDVLENICNMKVESTRSLRVVERAALLIE